MLQCKVDGCSYSCHGINQSYETTWLIEHMMDKHFQHNKPEIKSTITLICKGDKYEVRDIIDIFAGHIKVSYVASPYEERHLAHVFYPSLSYSAGKVFFKALSDMLEKLDKTSL